MNRSLDLLDHLERHRSILLLQSVALPEEVNEGMAPALYENVSIHFEQDKRLAGKIAQ